MAPDEAQAEDLDESVLPFEPEDDAEGARAMGADDEWIEPHPNADAVQILLIEKLRALGIPVAPMPPLGSNRNMPVLRWTAPSRRHDGFPYLRWLSHCNGFAPGRGRRRRR